MITAICQECNKQFDYELKKGYPRKYCFECSEVKQASFAAKETSNTLSPEFEKKHTPDPKPEGPSWKDNPTYDKDNNLIVPVVRPGEQRKADEQWLANHSRADAMPEERIANATIKAINKVANEPTNGNGKFAKDPVGLAVDIFCALAVQQTETFVHAELMKDSTDLVKQAMKELQ